MVVSAEVATGGGDAGAAPVAVHWRPVVDATRDLEYVPPDDEVDEDLKCCVCWGWPQDPVVLGCPGGHMLCRRCVKGPLCPMDRQPYVRVSAAQRPVMAILGRLRVRCPKAVSGCDWTGPRYNLADHQALCEFTLQECLGCGLRLLRTAAEFTAHTHNVSSPDRQEGDTEEVPPPSSEQTTSLCAQRRLEAIGRVIDAYEQAERLNVCFLVDSTGSMGSHINAVKRQIRWIVHQLRLRLPSMRLHLAFVGYRDHCDAERIETLPFTSSVDDFEYFVSMLRARGGGGDGPEDVHGALEAAGGLDWSVGDAATRVLIHVADYPAHGRQYNDCPRDSYPNGDPRGLILEDLIRNLQALSVQYVFGHITPHTRKMVDVLNGTFPGYIESKDMNNVALVAEVVTSSLHSSVSSTVSTLTSNVDAQEPPVTLSDEVPDWEEIAEDTIQLRICRPVTDVNELLAGSDSSATRRFDGAVAALKLAPLPFAQGETRVSRHALRDGAPAVAKHFKRELEEGDEAGEALFALSEASAVASFLADLYSASQPQGEKIVFLSSSVASGDNLVPFNVEDALPAAAFQRFSNNVGWWEPDAPRRLLQFSRFTHEVTGRHMMVVDLQGVKTDEGWILTDPCILCEDVERFGAGNLGPHAMDRCLTTLTARLAEPEAALPEPPQQDNSVPVPPLPWRPPRTAPVNAQDVGLDPAALIDSLRGGRQTKPNEEDLKRLLRVARDSFLRQPTLLELQAPINVMGDTHGQFNDLLRMFDLGGSPPDVSYLMLGDYVDRGQQSIETVSLLLAYKVLFPENMFMLRGNHECAAINRVYGFYDECRRRYNIKLWKLFTDVFNCLPPAAVIDDRIFCAHGGPSPELTRLDQIRDIPRPSDVPDSGLLCDLLWADPDPGITGWVENDRGVSYMFGEDTLRSLEERLGIELIARAHQVVEDGYEFFAQRRLVTIFSAPNYCGEFDNAAALMEVKDDLMCSFKVLQPQRRGFR